MTFYRALLFLLSERRRAVYGDEMADVFAQTRQAARKTGGQRAVAALWIRELVGLLRFALRDRWGFNASQHGSQPVYRQQLGTEFRRAWRAVRARGWAAVLSICLLGVTFAANGIVFSVVDARVFTNTPFKEPHQLVYVTTGRQTGIRSLELNYFEQILDAPVLDHVTGYSSSVMFLTGDDTAVQEDVINVTPGIFDLLRVQPRWGRRISVADIADPDVDAVVVGASLAQRRFGEPAAAVGQIMETTEVPLRIVGVMASDFRFPYGGPQIWRGFAPDSPVARAINAVTVVGRLRDGNNIANSEDQLQQIASTLGTSLDGQTPFEPTLRAFDRAPTDTTRYWALLGAAICLLLTACANTASVELTGALGRARTYAIQRSLGASRWLLARGALLEGALIVGGAALLGSGLATGGLQVVNANLPDAYGLRPLSVIDVDTRMMLFMLGAAAVAWLATCLPVVAFASRADAAAVLKQFDRSQIGSRAALLSRRALTVAQVALAIVLMVAGLLYTRTYLSRLNVEKGFDSNNLASLTLIVPPHMMSLRASAGAAVVERLSTHPAVVSVMADGPPQDSDTPFTLDRLEIDGAWRSAPELRVARRIASVNYHEVVRIPLRSGRSFEPDEPSNHVIVNEHFADQFWSGDAVGHTFRLDDDGPLFQIVGVVGHVRTREERVLGESNRSFRFYQPKSKREAALPSTTPPVSAGRRIGGPSFTFITITVRLTSPSALEELLIAVRQEVPYFAATAAMVDDTYAGWEAETLLHTKVIGALGALVFLVSVAGIYGVMTFLVASRTREIGVRMALGATQQSVAALVLKSSIRLAAVGAIVGSAAAVGASRYIESELFGVSATDPSTYALVVATIITGATFAAWQPIRRAARTDPATTLRAE